MLSESEVRRYLSIVALSKPDSSYPYLQDTYNAVYATLLGVLEEDDKLKNMIKELEETIRRVERFESN